MNIMTKIVKWFKSSFQGDDEINIKDATEGLEEQKFKLQDSLTKLYFNQSKLEDQRTRLQNEAEELSQDLELAVKAGRDALSVSLLEKIDDVKDQVIFIDNQLVQIEKDIEMAIASKKELNESSTKFRSSLETYQARKNILETKKQIKEQLGAIRNEIDSKSSGNTISKFADKIHMLNAQIKSLDIEEPVDKELHDLRKNKVNNQRLDQLEKLKRKFLSKDVVIVK